MGGEEPDGGGPFNPHRGIMARIPDPFDGRVIGKIKRNVIIFVRRVFVFFYSIDV